MPDDDPLLSFVDLKLPEPLARAVAEAGYETPSPIQAKCIPLLLAGHDVLGQAQTGTGKTAAFSLPLLARVETARRVPQLLALTPTRELAIQVAEAMQAYAHFLDDFHVLPIYGGQSYTIQLRSLRRGVQVVVGTPGRVMDHMRRGTLKLDQLSALVLDEADEMLRMGFIDDVKWVLENTPANRQIALFSATMPKEIRKVAEEHLTAPQVVRIEATATTAATIRQRYWVASGLHKLDALTRVLETEPFDAILIFVRTKTATVELAEKLAARGFSAEALNGDISQPLREKIVDRLRDGRLDVLIATDVVARGLDVQRISHVINYDIPYDTESYVHRIGRTGRAGRTGDAILFVAPRERRMLKVIERAIGQPIDSMEMPSVRDINEIRVQKFKQRVLDALGRDKDLSLYYQVVKQIEAEHDDIDPLQISATLACMVQGEVPLLLQEKETTPAEDRRSRAPSHRTPGKRQDSAAEGPISSKPKALKDHPDIDMERFRLEVGYKHGVKPGNIVGAIANEAELESQYIGNIEIYDDFTIIDLPAGMPKATFNDLKKVWVCQRRLQISRVSDGPDGQPNGGRTSTRKSRNKRSDDSKKRPTGKGKRKHKRKTEE